MRLLALAAAVSLLAAHAHAHALAQITGRVVGDERVLRSYAELGDATATLDGGAYSAPVRHDGVFAFHHVAAGSYLLAVSSRTFEVQQLRVDVSSEGELAISAAAPGYTWSERGAPVSHVEVSILAKKQHFAPREGFNLLGMLASPMVLMTLFSVASVFFLPMLMKSIDMDELREQQQQVQGQAQGQQQPAVQMPDISRRIAEMFSPPAQ